MIPDWPELDHRLSPRTGLTRAHWATAADYLLLSLRPYFSPVHAEVRLPGRPSSSGPHSDGLEGFARSFLLFGFRLAGEQGSDPLGFRDWYRLGLISGTDPSSEERWPLPAEVPQAKVEAASIALVLELTRPWLWDTLSESERSNVRAWLGSAVGEWYPANNWVWFRAVVETFLADVGGTYNPADIEDTLAFHESCAREHGWYSDSSTERAFDFYSGWAMQFYPFFWASQPGSARFGSAQLLPLWRQNLAEYLDDYVHLIGADGMPVLQGRSLIYRFAAAAPLWVGAVHGEPSADYGLLRRAANGMLTAFLSRGVPDEQGILNVGLTRSWPAMAQTYSGPGSPYWAAKGFYGLVLPESHPLWSSRERALPIEEKSFQRRIVAPGWLTSGTQNDGIVRVINHGTDHAEVGATTADSPLYARLGYSSRTFPPLGQHMVNDPVDQLATVTRPGLGTAHRSGFQRGDSYDSGGAIIGSSRARLHWVSLSADAHDHGSGYQGTVEWGPDLTVISAVCGGWEVRFTRIGGDVHPDDRLRVSAWPTDPEPGMWQTHASLHLLTPVADVRRETLVLHNVSPIADRVEVLALDIPAHANQVLVFAISLGSGLEPVPHITLSSHHGTVRWANGRTSEVLLTP